MYGGVAILRVCVMILYNYRIIMRLLYSYHNLLYVLEQKEGRTDCSQSYGILHMTDLPVESCAKAVASQNLLCKGTCRPLEGSEHRSETEVALHSAKRIIVPRCHSLYD